MPAMGDSVSEGTVLEWHKAEGDSVAADETLVEISTDKVDAEVPAPVGGTVVKVHAAEGDTIHVGAVLAEIAPTNGAAPAAAEPDGAAAPAEAEAAEEQIVDIVMPAMGESVSEGVVLEWAKQRRRRDRGRRDDRRDLHRQGRRRGARARVRHGHRDPRPGRRHRHRRPGDRAASPPAPGAPSAAAAPGAASRPRAPRPRRRRAVDRARGLEGHARRRSASPPRTGVDLAGVQGSGPAGRIGKDDVLAAADDGAAAAPPPRPSRRHADQGRRRRCSRATWTSRAQVPTATSFRTITVTTLDARRKQLKEAGQQRLLHAPDRLRDRARGDRADAGDGAPLRRDRRQAARDRRRRLQPRHRRRRRAQGRRPHADGAGHPRRRPADASRSSSTRSAT